MFPSCVLQAGAAKAATKLLLQEQDEGAAKAYTWLLCALTASHASPARAWICSTPEVLQRLLSLLTCSQQSAGEPTCAAAALRSAIA